MCQNKVFMLCQVLSVLLGCTSLHAAILVNGDFSSGLNGWTAIGPVQASSGTALMYDDLVSAQATLEQAFVVPAGAQSLSFSYSLSYTPDATSGSPVPDAFTASLLDPGNSPILSTPGFSDYFYHDNFGNMDYDPSIVTRLGSTVTLDLSAVPAGTNARIVFDLFVGDDGRTTGVTLDNVVVEAVPEPASIVVWAVLGLGLAAALRRRFGACRGL